MARPAFDVDLDAWKNRSAFHPANTRLKQLGHELARKAVVYLGELLHWLLPPSTEKSIAFQRLDEVRLYAGMALAVNGGPREMANSAEYTEAAIMASLRDFERVDLPSDPRIKEYEAEQRGETFPPGADPGLKAAVEAFLDDPEGQGEERPTLPGAAPDAPRQGMTGVAVQQADYAAIPGERPTAPEGTFHWTDDAEDVQVDVFGKDGEVQLILTDPRTGVTIAKVLDAPFPVNQLLSALAAAGDRVFQ